MKNTIMAAVIFWLLPTIISGQQTNMLSGWVLDETKEPLPGATVSLNQASFTTVTDLNGHFIFSGLSEGKYSIEISFLGYERYIDTMDVSENIEATFVMEPALQTLQEAVVIDSYTETRKKEESLSIEIVDDAYLKQNLSGSLMQSLERLPGVSTIDVGSGQSKPVIRGISFNRVVVAENGIKHQGQQWGADHGLEIDQYAADHIEVVKGPASLLYGSDAIGGVIDIRQDNIPAKNSFGGAVDLTAKSNNAFLGSSVNLFGRKKGLFFTSRVTLVDFGDYRVPADSIDIYSYKAALDNQKLRNTAGNEQNIHFSAGFVNSRFSNQIFISRINSKNGFFANAHGVEPRMVDTDLHDKSARDIQYPFHKVEHFKLINKTEWKAEKLRFELELGYQNNFREERSEYVNHGYMPANFPENMNFPADLERQFNKDVYSGNFKGYYYPSNRVSISAGVNSEYQDNRIDGRGFIIPEFTQFNIGSFVYGRFNLSEVTLLHAGIRHDVGELQIKDYFDWYSSPVENDGITEWQNLMRASAVSRNFQNFSWSLGVNHNFNKITIKANLGKSFRMPIAKELAANGVNYHHFSYEVGDASLSPEISYQADLGFEFNRKRLAIGLTPFLNYFSNYIYLNPSDEHDRLYGNGNQVFYYKEAEVLRFGGEIHSHYDLFKPLKIGIIGEYVYAEQLSGEKAGFTLPFSPPASLLLNAKYSPNIARRLKNPYFSVDYKLVANQNLIVPPEEKTKGYQTVSFSLGGEVFFGNQKILIALQIRNVFNQKYFNHTSYYRLINVPEAGRNFILNINIPFITESKKE